MRARPLTPARARAPRAYTRTPRPRARAHAGHVRAPGTYGLIFEKTSPYLCTCPVRERARGRGVREHAQGERARAGCTCVRAECRTGVQTSRARARRGPGLILQTSPFCLHARRARGARRRACESAHVYAQGEQARGRAKRECVRAGRAQACRRRRS